MKIPVYSELIMEEGHQHKKIDLYYEKVILPFLRKRKRGFHACAYPVELIGMSVDGLPFTIPTKLVLEADDYSQENIDKAVKISKERIDDIFVEPNPNN
jgi:hypothetical protein